MHLIEAISLAQREFGPRASVRGIARREVCLCGDDSQPEEVLGSGATYAEALADAVRRAGKEQGDG